MAESSSVKTCLCRVRLPPGSSSAARRSKSGHRNGSITHLLASASPLRDATGAVRGAVGAFFDVTGRKQMEDLLRERADLLWRRNRQHLYWRRNRPRRLRE